MGFYPFVPLPVSGALITPPVNLQGATQATELFGTGVTGDTFNRIELRAGSSLGVSGGIGLGAGNIATDTFLGRSGVNTMRSSGGFQVQGIIDAMTVGSGLQVAEGSNAKQGTAVLVAGTVTVANTAVTANSRILLTSNLDGGAPGFVRVSARVAGTSFTITSSSGTDTSTIAYEIFEPG
jgi:hypothetical protein